MLHSDDSQSPKSPPALSELCYPLFPLSPKTVEFSRLIRLIPALRRTPARLLSEIRIVEEVIRYIRQLEAVLLTGRRSSRGSTSTAAAIARRRKTKARHGLIRR